MLYLKLMSNEAFPDADPCKNFTLVPVSDTTEISFRTDSMPGNGQIPDSSTVVAVLHDAVDDTFRELSLTGNAYVLNAQGKTIASRGAY